MPELEMGREVRGGFVPTGVFGGCGAKVSPSIPAIVEAGSSFTPEPHEEQNFAVAGTAEPHCEQYMEAGILPPPRLWHVS